MMLKTLKWIRAAALLVTAFSLTNCSSTGAEPKSPADQGGDASSSESEWTGKAAPLFTLQMAEGSQAVSLEELRGKVVVVDFWATWCDPCKESFPSYQRLSDEFGEDLVVLGVSVDEESDDIPAFRKATAVNFTLLWDNGGKTAQEYAPPKMPTSFVIDQFGIVRHVHAGYHDGEEDALRREIKALIAK